MKLKKLASAIIAATMIFAPVSAMAEVTTPMQTAPVTTASPDATVPLTPLTPAITDGVMYQEEVPSEDVEPSLQINGVDMASADATPIIVKNRVYVPFRSVFEALNAKEITFDEATKKVTATRDDKIISFVVGQKAMEITTGAKTTAVDADAASFVSGGTTYVPVRFAAQALDCKVGWDDSTKTVIIIDKASLVDNTATYKIMNAYIAASKKFAEKTYALTGTMNLDMTMTDGTDTLPVKGTGTITGITDSTSINMDTTFALDLSKVKEILEKEEALDETSVKMFDALSNMTFNFIFDMESAKFFIQSDVFSTLMGTEAGAWYSLDMAEMFDTMGAGTSFTDLLAQASKISDMKVYLVNMAENLPVDSSYMTPAMISSYKMLQDAFKDSAFVEKDDNYVSTYKMDQDGATSTMSMTLPKDATKSDFTMVSTTGYNGTEIMKMTMEQKDLAVTFAMTMGMAEMFSMDFSGNLNYTETNKKPMTAPAKDAKVVPLTDLLFSSL